MRDDQRGVLHRHEDGREHRHFSAGFTIGGQVIEDADGTEDHQHSVLGVQPGDVQNNSGPVVWCDVDVFVLDNAEQLDLSSQQAKALVIAGLMYNADPANRAYYTTPWNVSLDNVEVMLECNTCGGTGRHETTLEDSPTTLVDLGPCPECPLAWKDSNA